MLSTLTAPSAGAAEASTVEALSGTPDEMADNRSSSLSELGDASDDDQSEATPRPTTTAADDDDSEAETERLDHTPRKITRAGTDTSLLSEPPYTRTPSKLAHSKTIDHDEFSPPTPSVVVDDTAAGETAVSENPLHSLSLIAASEAANLEFAGKKRKRSSGEGSPAEGVNEEEPARKRSSQSKSPNGLNEGSANTSEQVDAEEELENAEERLSQLAHEELELEERQANIATETVNEMVTVAKHTKPRKGGRRGKRKPDDSAFANDALANSDMLDGDGEGEGDDEDSAALDEEAAKKKSAIDSLAKIQKKFKVFRDKICDEQIQKCEKELEMLKQPNCVHPEYLAMIKAVDERRSEKIAYETRLLEYKQKNLEVITIAERHQMHSQYFQTIRQVREEILEECNQRVFELQRGRRQLGNDETEYMIKLPEKRSDQIRHQTAYNLEVSVLSGVAKYVGFPAAPDISPARPTEIDDDLRAMKIATRAPAPPPSFRTYGRTATADEAAAEEQFLESTPWANPRHPAHQETRYAGPSRLPSYQTPAGQRRVVDLTAPNGSASTIDATSNPPSSTARPTNGRLGESESPVLQMKRPPNEQPSYMDTPGSARRDMGILGRETYGMMSSPAAPPAEQGQQHWSGPGMRPGGTNASGPSGSQHGLGSVSVGSGLFGR